MQVIAGYLLTKRRKAIACPEVDHILHSIPVGIGIIIKSQFDIFATGSKIKVVGGAILVFLAYFLQLYNSDHSSGSHPLVPVLHSSYR